MPLHFNSSRSIGLQLDMEEFGFTQWGGVRIAGKGLTNKVVGFFVNKIDLINDLIRKKTEAWIRRIFPEQMEKAFNRLYDRVDGLVASVLKRYSQKTDFENEKKR